MPLPREPVLGQPLGPLWGQQLQRHVAWLTSQIRPPQPRAKPVRGGAPAASAKYHPFQIIHVSDGGTGDPGVVQVSTGRLGSDLAATSSETLTGLSTNLDVEDDYLIFLRWNSTDNWDIYAEDVASLTHWADYPDLIKHSASDPYPQTDYWVLLGYVGTTPADVVNTPGFAITIDATARWVYQCLRTDLLEQALCYNGLPAVYPFAHPAPYL